MGDGYNQVYPNLRIHFDTLGVVSVDTMSRYVPFIRTLATISDNAGNLKFFTNGIHIYDSTGVEIPNSTLI